VPELRQEDDTPIAPDPNFFFQHEPSFDDQNLLHHWNAVYRGLRAT
jgi:hypothetical protein